MLGAAELGALLGVSRQRVTAADRQGVVPAAGDPSCHGRVVGVGRHRTHGVGTGRTLNYPALEAHLTAIEERTAPAAQAMEQLRDRAGFVDRRSRPDEDQCRQPGTLREYGVPVAVWLRLSPSCDVCGCPDDRCIGSYHDVGEDCDLRWAIEADIREGRVTPTGW